MTPPSSPVLRLENRHTGEILELQRRHLDGDVVLQINGSLPPHSEGPPLHIHPFEDEEGEVISGTITAIVGDRRITARAGEKAILPKGVPHRWWNDHDELLRFQGMARPVVDLDRFLQGAFEMANASPTGRPSLFYLAHLIKRHWRTQHLATGWRPFNWVLITAVVAVGTVLGRYRGEDWPGAPARCPGAPMA